jgi:oxygen-independent coproporphyrinogen-3 oxidase
MERYQKALLRHLDETAARAGGWRVDTVYFGGGTPSYYGAERLAEVLKTVKKKFGLDPGAEITLEANPDSLDLKILQKLRKAGFNRISIGIQSALDEDLMNLRRAHTFGQAQKAVEEARAAGFRNVGIDLMFGLPEQDMERWDRTLRAALDLAPEHISCYGLKLEPGTKLYERRGKERIPDDDVQADLYLHAVETLCRGGYEQYEISNFSKPGFPSRHNLKYWTCAPFIGLGPAAHSDFGDCRYSFVKDLDAYIDGMMNGDVIVDECETLTKRDRASEYLMLRLRTAAGISGQEYRRTYGMNFDPLEQLLREYRSYGWAEEADGRWRLTAKGFFVSNRLIGALLERQEELTLAQVLPGGKRE